MDQLKIDKYNNVLKLLFSQQCVIYGGTVRDFIIPEKKKKIIPTDIDLFVDDLNYSLKILKILFANDYKIEEVKMEQPTYTNKISKSMKLVDNFDNSEIILDISEKKDGFGNKLDFDINGIYMTDFLTFKLPKELGEESLGELISKINSKKFSIIPIFKIETQAQCFRQKDYLSKVANSLNLIEFVKMMSRTCNMLKRGWKLVDQELFDIFEPCLIEYVGPVKKNCKFMNCEIQQYGLKLYCCEEIVCFCCTLKYIKKNFYQNEICCPFCFCDPFGWNTCSRNNRVQESSESDEDIYIYL